MASDRYVLRAEGYGSLRKGEPPVKQRPPPPAPMMPTSTQSDRPPGRPTAATDAKLPTISARPVSSVVQTVN